MRGSLCQSVAAVGAASGEPATRIVLVDDDSDSREIFAMFLRMSGFEVDDFESAESALESIRTAVPAVVVVDIEMDGLDGYEAGRHVRAIKSVTPVRIIAVTGHAAATVKMKGGDLFDAILTKPVDPDAFIALVQKLLSPS